MSGLAAVGECALTGGFRPTVLTCPVVVIDVAVRVVAGVWATDTLVVRWKRLKRPVVRRGLDGSHVFAERTSVNVVRAGARHHVAGHVVQRHDVVMLSEIVVTLCNSIINIRE